MIIVILTITPILHLSANMLGYLLGFKESNFNAIYFAAMQYLIETVTTVGYGELVGKSLYEIIFQIIMLIVGTCIYSWLISTISTYVKKINEKKYFI